MEADQPDRPQRLSLVPLREANARLEALLRELQRDDPLAPVTVAGPSNYANLSLRHHLGRGGFANVRFMGIARLAELLGAPALTAPSPDTSRQARGEAKGKQPLTGPVEAAAVRAAAEEARGPLAALRDHPALHRSLRATFRDLRRASPEAVERAGAGDPLHVEVVRLYRRWTALTADFYDREALAWSAAPAVAEGKATGLRDLGAVVFHLPTGLSPGERALAGALMRHAACHAVLGLTGDAQADEGVLELARVSGWDGELPASDEDASAQTQAPGEPQTLRAPQVLRAPQDEREAPEAGFFGQLSLPGWDVPPPRTRKRGGSREAPPLRPSGSRHQDSGRDDRIGVGSRSDSGEGRRGGQPDSGTVDGGRGDPPGPPLNGQDFGRNDRGETVFKERSAGSTHILIAPDPREEVAWVLRRAMQAADAGTPLHRMAVLYRQAQPYARLVREQCGLADIPIAGPSASALGESAAGRALSGLLRLAAGDLAREEVMAWLTGCPIVPPQGAAESFHPSQWDRISRAAGIVRGREQWRDRLDRYATERERQAENAEVREERSEAALRWMAREASDARALGAFIEDLASDLASAEELRTWQDRADWALRLLERYMGRRGGFPEAEAAAWELVTDGLQELPSAGAVRTEVTFDAFADAVQELLASTTGHSGRTGTGLFVATFGAALGMEFDRVFLVGMVEGAVPPRVVDDPLLPDQARRRASAASDEDGTGIPLRGTRARDERYAYLAALASAPDRVLSFPKGDPASQRGQFPSRWVLEQASILEGARVFSTTLERLGARSWLTRVASRQDALRRAGEGAAVDLHDHDLRSLSGWRDRGLAVAAHHLATAGTRLHQALTMLGSRAGTALSPWEGDVSALAPTSRRLRPAAERRVMSPTRLQTWAKCPFQYFLGSVLGLAALESPEETEVISPLDKGSLVHGVLERFLRKAVEDGPPAPGEPWSPEHRAMLREMAEEAFRDMEARGLTGKAFLWGLERELMLDDLDEFLRQDAKLREELGSTPWLLEMAFGFAPGPGGETATAPELTLADGTTLAFRGMIDRIDRTADGGVLVFDYKTGSDWPYRALDKDPVDRGRLLQLPLYGMAARQVVGPGAPVRSAYWFVTTKGGFVRRPSTPLPLDAAMPAFQEAVTVITAGIGNGYFPANPGSEKSNCMFCDFDKLCGVRREGVWERKRRDPRLGAYVRLAGEAGDESEQ